MMNLKLFRGLKTHLFLTIIFIAFVLSCKEKNPGLSMDYYRLPAIGKIGVNVVVEIPAGTNHKIEYDPISNSFKNDIKEGKDRVISFLPYPGNYGFIPSTMMDTSKGGDGDALDVLVIGETEPTGKVLEVKLIAALLLLDEGETDTKLIAIPADAEKQVISPSGFIDFTQKHSEVKTIIESWFLNYKGKDVMQLQGWSDEEYAFNQIEQWKMSK